MARAVAIHQPLELGEELVQVLIGIHVPFSRLGERRIPIGVFLTSTEMEKLRKWKEQRVKMPGIGPADCLFGIRKNDPNPVSEKIFSRINQFMRPAGTVNSAEEHFHELRHGFGTWMFLVMQDALALYIHNVDRENFVRLSDLSHCQVARRYVYFLNQLKVPRTTIRFVSGDSQEDSQYRRSWNKSLGAHIEPRPAGGDFGPKSAISILPKEKWNSKISIKGRAFRFFLVMAFIVFGELPVTPPTY